MLSTEAISVSASRACSGAAVFVTEYQPHEFVIPDEQTLFQLASSRPEA